MPEVECNSSSLIVEEEEEEEETEEERMRHAESMLGWFVNA